MKNSSIPPPHPTSPICSSAISKLAEAHTNTMSFASRATLFATPSPPRIRHTPGPSRYERDEAAAAAAAIAANLENPLTSTHLDTNATNAEMNTKNPNLNPDTNTKINSKATTNADVKVPKPVSPRVLGDGLDVKIVGDWKLGKVIGKGTSGELFFSFD